MTPCPHENTECRISRSVMSGICIYPYVGETALGGSSDLVFLRCLFFRHCLLLLELFEAKTDQFYSCF